MAAARPEVVFLAAAKVGGILANDSCPADFLYDNLMIEANVIQAALAAGVEKLLFLGSSCIYRKLAPQPMRGGGAADRPARADQRVVRDRQDRRHQAVPGLSPAVRLRLHLGDADESLRAGGQLRPAGLARASPACCAGRTSGPRPGSGTLPIWGSGTPRREFLHVDDCADALVHLMQHWSDAEHVNLGSGSDLSIAELARLVMRTVGLEGEVIPDPTKPDGTPRKLLDVSVMRRLGWAPASRSSAGCARSMPPRRSRAIAGSPLPPPEGVTVR